MKEIIINGRTIGAKYPPYVIAELSANHNGKLQKALDTITEAKACGADVILLIAAVLSQQEIKNLSEFAKSLGMDVLLEVHDLDELQKSIMPSLDMLGVNNRNLKTFEVSLDISKTLSTSIPDDFIKVSESGISSVAAIKELMPYGYKGFLIGENFMKTDNPGLSAETFINQL